VSPDAHNSENVHVLETIERPARRPRSVEAPTADVAASAPWLSIVICNYNYAAFVAQAIDSALSLDWPDVEVIVVDDGSTDGSRAIIDRYADRVTVIHQANAGQWAACNAGFARSRGEVVIFLDSDDLLDPSLARRLAAVWREGLSKVQFQMRVVDEKSQPTGELLPQFHVVPSCDDIRRWAFSAAAYPTPPGSGNAYSRAFLSKIFPLPKGDRAADSYCLAAAPYLGDVLTIAEPLVSYRVHGKNQGAMGRLDARRFAFEMQRAYFRLDFARSAARGVGVPRSNDVLDRSLTFLPLRLASLVLEPEAHPVANDSVLKLLRDLTTACFIPQGVSARARAALCLWAVSVTAAPPTYRESLLLWRFAPASRPRLLKQALRKLQVVKRYRAAS
jgi:glycosyltransferase involved in cell wall biosynthesis